MTMIMNFLIDHPKIKFESIKYIVPKGHKPLKQAKLVVINSDTYKEIRTQKGKTHTMGCVSETMSLKQKRKWQKLCNKVKKRDKYKCRRCESKSALIFHHIKPRSKGGKNTMRNLITLCNSCHDWVELNQPKRIRRIKT